MGFQQVVWMMLYGSSSAGAALLLHRAIAQHDDNDTTALGGSQAIGWMLSIRPPGYSRREHGRGCIRGTTLWCDVGLYLDGLAHGRRRQFGRICSPIYFPPWHSGRKHGAAGQ